MGLGQDIDISSFINEIKGLFIAKKQYQQGETASTIGGSIGKYQVPIKSDYHNSGGFDPTGKGNVGRVHQGLDLRASGGTSIYPIAPGVVTAVRPDPKGGNTVNVKHAGGVTSYYAHMGTIAVHNGDNVDTNTVLGTVGASGNARGFPHLHLQVWKDGTLVDPATVISVPKYTAFNPQTEKLWLPNAKETADKWNLQEHVSSRRKAIAERTNKLVALADAFHDWCIR